MGTELFDNTLIRETPWLPVTIADKLLTELCFPPVDFSGVRLSLSYIRRI